MEGHLMEDPENPDRTHTAETEHDDPADELYAPQDQPSDGEDEREREESRPE
jgi:hypothetical protein